MNQLKVVGLICDVTDAMLSEKPAELLRVFEDDKSDTELRRQAKLFIATRLNCNFITEIETAAEAMNAYKNFLHKVDFTREMEAHLLSPATA